MISNFSSDNEIFEPTRNNNMKFNGHPLLFVSRLTSNEFDKDNSSKQK